MLTDGLEGLLRRICKFLGEAGSERYPKILRYLAEHSFPDNEQNRQARKAASIAKELFGDDNDGVIRNNIKQIKKKVDEYYLLKGATEPKRLTIGEGGPRGVGDTYLIGFKDNLSATPDLNLKRFWRPHLDPPDVTEDERRETVLIYNEPRFFRHPDDDYLLLRHQDINDKTAPGDFGRLKVAVITPEMRSSRYYIAAGDALCLLSLVRFFDRQNVMTKLKAAHVATTWPAIEKSDLVVLGNHRCTWAVEELQRDEALDFDISDHMIEDRRTGKKYEDVAKTTKLTRPVYGVVTRMPSPSPGHWITMIAANHTRAFEKIGRAVSREKFLVPILARCGYTEQPIPDRFQLLLSVHVNDEEHAMGEAQYLAHREQS